MPLVTFDRPKRAPRRRSATNTASPRVSMQRSTVRSRSVAINETIGHQAAISGSEKLNNLIGRIEIS
jgi:hypothetical protein